jgi:hypothetical protein
LAAERVRLPADSKTDLRSFFSLERTADPKVGLRYPGEACPVWLAALRGKSSETTVFRARVGRILARAR